MMRLRYAKASPFVRKVMVALHETGQLDRVTLEEGGSSPLDPNPEILAVNPLGRIPCLVLESGLPLHDSRVITRYLDTTHAGAKLYPSGEALWPVLALEATADGMMEAALAVVYEARFRPEEMRSAEIVAAQKARIARTLDAWEAEGARTLEAGVDMGRLAVACALGYVDFRLTDWDWRAGRPQVAAWAERMLARPSLAATAPA